MRVAIITKYFPVVSETFILHHITGLLDRGHSVDIFADDVPPHYINVVHPAVREYGLRARYANVLSCRGIRRYRHGLRAIAACAVASPRATTMALDPRQFGSKVLGLAPIFRLAALRASAGEYDVVHAHFGPVGNDYRTARALLGAPLVVSFHGFDVSVWPRVHGLNGYRRLFSCLDAAVANSAYTERSLLRLGCPPDKIAVIPAIPNVEAFPYSTHSRMPGDPTRLLTVARLVEKKGVADVLRAIALLRRSGLDVCYEVVGYGPLRQSLELLASELGIADLVTFHGAADTQEVKSAMAKAHIFVLASVTSRDGNEEGQGLVLMEAQAAGLPVLATQHGPFAESVRPGESAILVPERDPAALASGISKLVAQPDLCEHMGRVGRAFVLQSFNTNLLLDKTIALYERLAR